MPAENMIASAIAAFIGFVVVFVFYRSREKALKESFERKQEASKAESEQLRLGLEESSREELDQFKTRFEEERQTLVDELKETRSEINDLRQEISQRERSLKGRERKLQSQETDLTKQEEKVKSRLQELEETLEKEKTQLLSIAHMTHEEARESLLKQIDKDCQVEQADVIHRVVTETKKEAGQKAQEIIAEALVRCASEQTAASTVSTVDLPSDDIKGRIIGREGRNIRAFERITGIDVIVDDTPGVIVLSGFDALRREVAVMTMKKLLSDGRIHPNRIEDIFKDMKSDLEKQIVELGQQAILDLNIQGLPTRIFPYVGRLNYKIIRGQNVLQMSKIVSSLCATVATEFGLNENHAKMMGLLAFIGMTESQDVEGSVAHVGSQMARRFGCPKAVVHAIASSSSSPVSQAEPRDLYGVILQVSLKIAKSRPGASHDQVQRYIKRLEEIEGLALDSDGVREVYAIQAGNELRVVVDPVKVSDKMAMKLAREIAQKIKLNSTYPGSIVVNLLREAHSVSYAR